jgi:fructose-1,6-bisphosphatase II
MESFQKEALLALEDVTEETSRAVFPLFGKDDKLQADYLAVEKMRALLSALPFGTRVILGEGEKDDAPMLYEGEILGQGPIAIDLVVDPLECTTNFAKGLPNSMSVIAYAKKDCMVGVPGTYMEQWIAGPRFQGGFEPYSSLLSNIERLGESLNKDHSELLIVVQDRPRHESLIRSLRNLGVGVSLIDSGSITAALDICLDKGHYDAMIGTFGAPEGLIAAIIARCTGSEMKGILRPHKEIYKEKWKSSGFEDGQVLDKTDFIKHEFCGFIGSILSTNIIGKGITSVHGIMNGSSIIISNLGTEIHSWEKNIYGT